MKAEDFKISYCPSGKTQYLHVENGKKRELKFKTSRELKEDAFLK